MCIILQKKGKSRRHAAGTPRLLRKKWRFRIQASCAPVVHSSPQLKSPREILSNISSHPPKNKYQKVGAFLVIKQVRFLTTFHHTSTTFSPQKTTLCIPLLQKPPQKGTPPRQHFFLPLP
jgi:hypothetical protein